MFKPRLYSNTHVAAQARRVSAPVHAAIAFATQQRRLAAAPVARRLEHARPLSRVAPVGRVPQSAVAPVGRVATAQLTVSQSAAAPVVQEAVFWERQFGGAMCRMHAMNGVLGRAHFTWASFLRMAADFDVVARLPAGTSAALYVATDGQTLFQFAMSGVLPHSIMAVSTHRKSAGELDVARGRGIAAFVFNAGHAWALKRQADGSWLKLDSLSGVSRSSMEAHWVNGIGIEVVLN